MRPAQNARDNREELQPLKDMLAARFNEARAKRTG